MEARDYTEQDQAGCLAIAAARSLAVDEVAVALGRGRWWVLEHEGAVVAFGGLAEKGEMDELIGGMVDPRFERQGLGRYLLMLRQRHARAPRLEVEAPAEYRRFWEKNGFRAVAESEGRVRFSRKMAVCA